MNQVDQLISSLGDDTPADDGERTALHAARRVLRAAIAAERVSRGPSTDGRLRLLAESSKRIGRSAHGRRGRAVALFAALAIIGVAVPAFGVVGDGWIAGPGEIEGVRGSADPKLTGSPVVVASGEPEQPWKIVIARSNQGLCLNVEVGDGQFNSANHRLGDCWYSDIRGDLPPDVRGDPSAACIGSTELVPCGSRPEYWIQLRGGSFVPEIRRSILVGAAAAGVASVELILVNGGTLDAEVVERPLGPDVPLSVYWAELGPEQGLKLWRNAYGQLMPCADNLVEMVVARDSKGRVLGGRVPAWNANPSGDPDGPRRPHETTACV